MKIIVVSFYLPPTDRIGSGVQMHMLANEYARLGHDVTVLTPASSVEADAKYKLCSVQLTGKNRVWQWAHYLSTYTYNADIVHFNGDDFLVPSSTTFIHMRTFMGSCFAEARVATNLKDRFRMFCLGMTECISSMRFPIATVISSDTNKYLCRDGTLIPCGVDLTVFKSGVVKHVNPTVLFVGTLDSRKRGRLLLDQFQRQVQTQIPSAELWLVRETAKLEAPGITVFGSVSQDKLISLYQSAWVFCLPSSYEGFGVPYIEAMACGTPVVSTPNPGALEVLGNGRYGVIADIDKLGQSLYELLNDKHRREQLIMLGLDRVRQYDIQLVAKSYIELVTSRIK